MDGIMNFVSRYGTLVAIGAAGITAALQAYGIMVPEYLYTVEGAFGLAVFRTTVSVAGAGPGWKSFAVALIAGGIASAQAAGIDVPPWILTAIATVGLGTVTVAVKKV